MTPSRSLAFLLLSIAAAAEPVNPRIVERYKQMLQKKPAEGTALDRLWKTYSDAGKAGDLLKEYEAAKDFADRMVLGHLLRRAERGEEAIAAYQAAAALDAASPLPHLGIARVHTQVRRNTEAAAAWEAAAARTAPGDPRLTEALLEAGNAWLAAGESAKAAAAWEKTVAAAPKDSALRERLVETYLTNGLLDSAIPHLEYIVANGAPKARAEGLKQLARVHQLAGRADAAIQSLEKAIALTAPGNWLRDELQDQLIRYHQRLHRTEELENRWLAYAAKNPRDVTAYLQLLALYERLGELEKARGWLEKLVALVPKDFGYRWKLARLHLRLDDTKAAAALYDQLLAVQPANAELVFERAELDVRTKRPDEGAKRVAQFAASQPDDEATRGRVLQFYEQHHLTAWTERQLRSDARGGRPEKVRLLVDFLFLQGQSDAAEKELMRLARTNGTPAEQAASLLEIAQILKSHARIATALLHVQKALALIPRESPAARDAYLLSAELHLAQKDPISARDALEVAVTLSRSTSEVAAADQKLFDVLRLGPTGEEVRSPASSVIPTLAVPGGTSHLTGELRAFVDGLADEAAKRNTEDAWLRLARWRSWTRDKGGALEAARRAVDVAPKSVAAHEALINLASSEPASPTASAYLQKLAELDPQNRTKHVQRLAQFKLQSGNLRDARAALEELAIAEPGNLDVLQDLAHVQERSHEWAAAAETWRKVYRAGQSSRNRDALAPLLRAMEELGQTKPAAEMLLAEVNAAADPAVRSKLFDQLLALCTKHELLPWLSE
ncbi:MAG: tetratricopeptide repeat protein, partial [Chthoniobacteraceae bacterium]